MADTRFADELLTALAKPFSGGVAREMIAADASSGRATPYGTAVYVSCWNNYSYWYGVSVFG